MTGSFFKGAGSFEVEARDAAGSQVDASDRNVVSLIRGITSRIGHSLAGAAMLAASVSALALPAGTPASALVQPMAGESIDEAYARLSTSELVKKYVKRVDITDKQYAGFEGPSMSYKLEDKANTGLVCNLSLYGVGNVFEMMEQGRAALTKDDRQMMRAIIVFHEMAHCEIKASEMKKLETGQQNVQSLQLDYLSSFVQNERAELQGASTEFAETIHELILERQADIKTSLIVARLVFERSDLLMPEKLALFDRHIEMLKLLRISEAKTFYGPGNDSFNTHDSLLVIKMLQSMVHKAASTPVRLKAFRDEFLEGDKPALMAMTLAVGSVREEKEFLFKNYSNSIAAKSEKLFVSPARKQLADAQKISQDLKQQLLHAGKAVKSGGIQLPAGDALSHRSVIAAKLIEAEANVRYVSELLDSSYKMKKTLVSHSLADLWPGDKTQKPAVQQMLGNADKSFSELSSIYRAAESQFVTTRQLLASKATNGARTCFDWNGAAPLQLGDAEMETSKACSEAPR